MQTATAGETRLERAVLPLTRANAGLSGVVALPDPQDAFAARALLADAAERTLDVQYYIWRNDISGTMLADALFRAAARGVRVRLLLDDNNTAGLDPVLAALAAHPNIEVRLFNPFTHRRWRVIDYLTDFSRVNRRMHNKSFTADGQATIVGGRNVGDEYFGANREVLFVDLDILAIGPAADDVSRDFERYWTSPSARPAAELLRIPGTTSSPGTALAVEAGKHPQTAAYLEALADSRFVTDLLSGELKFEWVAVTMVSDDPSKALDHASQQQLLWPHIRDLLDGARESLLLISPYFVPGKVGVAFFTAMARKGIKLTILTNSLEATDVSAVHAGYAKRRHPLIRAGISLFELKRTSSVPRKKRRRGWKGSSGSSLHAKTFSIDGTRAFVGSFNFDPRSARLNTELGFIIESRALANAITDTVAGAVPGGAYRVTLKRPGGLEWTEQRDGEERVHEREPGASLWRRLVVYVLSLLPIEWLL